jgi:site-specific DNA recombinase
MNTFTIAMYLRLSKDDDDHYNHYDHYDFEKSCIGKQSNSIQNQRTLIQDYILRQSDRKDCVIKEYCDDGYSGTNFDRPGITDLLKAVMEKRIDCIIVKDFSRFGRNYIEVGNYIETVFPFIGVQFVSINDNFNSSNPSDNSFRNTCGIEVAAKNLIYDYYSKDLSQKVKSTLQRKKQMGMYLGGYAPYGYQRAPIDKGKLVIDEVAAFQVKEIFRLTTEGYSRADIARILNDNKILTPAEHIMKYYKKNELWHPKNDKWYWTNDIIIRILQNEVYLGKTITGKYKRDVGSKKSILVSKDEWEIKEKTHEAIISEQLFEVVQKTFRGKSIKKCNSECNKNKSLIGKVKCGYCKYPMDWIKGKKPYYKCISRRFIKNAKCSTEHAFEYDLESILSIAIELLRNLLSDCNVPKISLLQKENNATINVELLLKGKNNTLKRLKLQEIKNYEKYKKDILSREEYRSEQEKILILKTTISNEIELMEEKIKMQVLLLEKTKREDKYTSDQDDNEKCINNKINCINTEMDKKLITSIIKTIYFYDNKHIEVICNFKDEYELVL